MAALPVALALAAPAMADPPSPYPAGGMTEDSCPASLAGLRALDERVLRSDWAWQCRYRADNAAIDPASPPRVVFIGDSITENWAGADPAFFSGGVISRGISGQTSPQMLVRFWQDVVALHPRVVHIMAGTNDIAGNTGPTTPEAYRNAVRAMVTLARANGIAVVIGSIPPSNGFGWNPALKPAPWIAELNAWLRDYASAEKAVFADYHAALAGPDGELPARHAPDGVHPNVAGYAVIRPIAERAIAEAEQGLPR
ncbi:lysophospholipase L1-like esterase [Novosphingobium kunmingense]|uniref:Lysophospholipase L1-like esterase n=1 Tax=Novosphingobium kunmingense TaxID=1211806 RepID=A0A2N0H5Q2_9SPHN|nr:GDSL-type esterase/lipase family protein [Novosphingobium kunmingense]PKB14250.1 lysophospholipase L1-like esterase [Novosphingobium kunmingense]